MADHDHRGPGSDHTASAEALERLLTRVGPLMGRQERAEGAEPDPPFARLDPTFARALRKRLTGREGASLPAPRHQPTMPRQHRPAALWLGLAAALVALALGAMAVATVGLVTVATTVLAVVVVAAVLVVRVRLGQ